MIEKDLEKFIDNLYKHDEDFYKYQDENKNEMFIAKKQLIPSLSYQECDKKTYDQLVFNQKIEKNMKFDEIEVDRPVVKSTITHKKEDETTLVNNKTKVKKTWLVQTLSGMSKIFNNYKEAKVLFDVLEEMAF